MASPIYQLINGTAVGTALILDHAQSPFNVSFAVEVLASGTSSFAFGVQFTLDDVNQATDIGQSTVTTVTWFPDANVGLPQTSSTVGNYMFPVRAVRCTIASASATSQVQFVVLQGYPNA